MNCPTESPKTQSRKAMCDKNSPQQVNDKMELMADATKKTFKVGSDSLQWINSTGKFSQTPVAADKFDACYYIIKTDKNLYKAGKIKMTFDSTDVISSFFSGPSLSKVKGAECDIIKKECLIDYMNVLLIVVQPDVETTAVTTTNKFEFTYQMIETEDIDDYRKFYVKHFTGEDGRRLLYIVGACIAILICLVICSICVCSYYCCCKPKVLVDEETGRRFSRRKSSKGSSFRASMRRSMRLESFVDRSAQSFRRQSMSASKRSLNDNSPPKAARIIKLNDAEMQ